MKLAQLPVLILCICFFQFISLNEVMGEGQNSKRSYSVRLGFHYFKDGKIYDEAYQGIVDGLLLSNLQIEEFIYRSDRSIEKATKNLKEMDDLDLDAIISFSSAGTQIAQSLKLQTPILASVINHPMSLGIEEGDNRQSTISGTSYYIDASLQLELYLDLYPDLKTIGMVFDKNNPAGFLAEEPLMRKACLARKIEFFSISATERNDVADAARSLVQKHVELIVIPTNLQIYDNLDLILEVTTPYKIPVVSMNKQGVEAGALAAFYADTYKMGRKMESIVREIFDNRKKVSDIPFVFSVSPDLILNLEAAEKLDYEFDSLLLGRASIVLN